MTDKERILMMVITRIIPGIIYGCNDKRRYVESFSFNMTGLNKGDLVYANTSLTPNDFMVGFIEDVNENYAVIREIGSKKKCNYYNESFTKINKEKLGYEILEGLQYETYQKVLKAFEKYTEYGTRFMSIYFEDNICHVCARKVFRDEIFFQISFAYRNKTTIKHIGEMLACREKMENDER